MTPIVLLGLVGAATMLPASPAAAAQDICLPPTFEELGQPCTKDVSRFVVGRVQCVVTYDGTPAGLVQTCVPDPYPWFP